MNALTLLQQRALPGLIAGLSCGTSVFLTIGLCGAIRGEQDSWIPAVLGLTNYPFFSSSSRLDPLGKSYPR